MVKRIEDIRRMPKKKTREVLVHNSRGVLRMFLGFQKHFILLSLAVFASLSHLTAFMAFEAHVVNVRAELVSIDAPVITPPGGIFEETLSITIDDADPDATHIFYTITPGTDLSAAPDPVCGDVLGGPKPQGPMDVTPSRVVKAIACDGSDPTSHASTVTTEVYILLEPVEPLSQPGGEVLGTEDALSEIQGIPEVPDVSNIPEIPAILPPQLDMSLPPDLDLDLEVGPPSASLSDPLPASPDTSQGGPPPEQSLEPES